MFSPKIKKNKNIGNFTRTYKQHSIELDRYINIHFVYISDINNQLIKKHKSCVRQYKIYVFTHYTTPEVL